MNFFEAMRELEAGKVIQSTESNCSYKNDKDGVLYALEAKPNDWSYGACFTNSEIDGLWRIVEPPKPKVKRWLWDVVGKNCKPFRTLDWHTEDEAKELWPNAKIEKGEEKEFDR